MTLNTLKPRQALNKAYLKSKVNRSHIEAFKTNLIALLDTINEAESEEFHKNLVADFLKNTWYAPANFINTKGRNDLVIHNTPNASGTVGVIIEAKKPSNKAEMVKPDNLNCKAFQELVLYYLRERITHKNLEIKHLVATNIFEWYIFDAALFEKEFAQNKSLVKQFTDFEEGRLSGTKTDFFYKEIAQPAIEAIKNDIPFTRFDIRDYDKPLRNNNTADDNTLIALYKLLSPEHLLKLPFANDSNSLDKAFYSELLHIIGLIEMKDGGKKLIQRKKEGERNHGSLLENTITQLDSHDKISRIPNPSQYGANYQERLFNVALELVITWVNRVLFLKLLEAQLIAYHKGDKQFAFLNIDKIRDFDDLDKLFFRVLARKVNERDAAINQLFGKVPYLNSSLFEPTELEHQTIFVSGLEDFVELPFIASTVIKDAAGKKLATQLNTIQYLFEFLNAYDFSSEGSEEIQENNKQLINASVLGLIFEKINGYKDGSFFTPGFITMYMCRETIRRAVLQKFNDTKNWNCLNLEQLYDKIDDRAEANAIVNTIKICDPAVGSGHFLVSALNEMIAVKSELKILNDRQGKRLKEYQLIVENDELIVTDEDGQLFEYNPRNPESQRIQETLFHEKQTIIENCLFGVDLNPNSVKICRLRLWIELLKNAYYKAPDFAELETLPNIDINIKCGNSLISRYALDADIKKALKASKWSIDSYRTAVMSYRNAKSKDEKRDLERLINTIKNDFESEVASNDKRLSDLNKAKGTLLALTTQTSLFERSKAEKAKWDKDVNAASGTIARLETQLAEIRNNRIYENAFEWRFEFPEVLNDEGDFVGFDVVIGNPPYIRQEEFTDLKNYLQSNYQTYAGTADLYVYFVERGLQIANKNGHFVYILPNKWMRAGYGAALRKWVTQYNIRFIHDFGDLPVFEEATTYPCLWGIEKGSKPHGTFTASVIDTLNFPTEMGSYIDAISFDVNKALLAPSGWTLIDDTKQYLLEKIKSKGIPLGGYVNGKVYYGIKTGFNEAFVIDAETKNRLIAEDANSARVIKPFLAGRDIKRYQQPQSEIYLILFKSGDTQKWFGKNEESVAWEMLKDKFPAIANLLYGYREKCMQRYDKGQYWWELRACDYYDEFEEMKIIYPNICKQPEFTFDNASHYANQKCFIIPKGSKYLLAILNSRLTFYLFQNILPKLRGDFYEPGYVYLKDFPIFDLHETSTIDSLVDQILLTKSQSPTADTTALEAEIDQLVYQLYGLTAEEIKMVEGE